MLKHQKTLSENPKFVEELQSALDIIEKEQQTRLPLNDSVDNQMYDGFWVDSDHKELIEARMAGPDRISDLISKTKNKRIREMIPLYKARNFPKKLSESELAEWEEYRRKSLNSGGEKSPIQKFYARLGEIHKDRKLSSNEEYLLTELQLYVESIIPEPEDSHSQE